MNNKKTFESNLMAIDTEHSNSRTGRAIAGLALAGTLIAGVTACGSETSGNTSSGSSESSTSSEVLYDDSCWDQPGVEALGNIDLTDSRWRVAAEGMTGNEFTEYMQNGPDLTQETKNWENIELIREDRERLLIDEEIYSGSVEDITDSQIDQIIASFKKTDDYAYYMENPDMTGEVTPLLYAYNPDGTPVRSSSQSSEDTPFDEMNFCIG